MSEIESRKEVVRRVKNLIENNEDSIKIIISEHYFNLRKYKPLLELLQEYEDIYEITYEPYYYNPICGMMYINFAFYKKLCKPRLDMHPSQYHIVIPKTDK